MSTYTATRTRKFGTDDQRDKFAAKYGSADYATVGRAIAAAQPTRQEATVNSTDRATRQTVERMVALAAERTPHVTEEQIFKFAATNSADVVHERLRWLEAQPVVKGNDVQDDIAWKNAAARQEAGQERQAYERKAARVEVPEGRYAIKGEDHVVRFYKVDRPTEGRWAGYVFVKIQASDELHSLRSKAAREDVLRRIAEAGIEESMRLYGLELGKCGHCGRTLTDEESRSYGIGPVCRGKMGW